MANKSLARGAFDWTSPSPNGAPFPINNVRGEREKPWLMRQHVTAIEAACAIGGADFQGLTVASSAVIFRPRAVTLGEYRFAVGTAG